MVYMLIQVEAGAGGRTRLDVYVATVFFFDDVFVPLGFRLIVFVNNLCEPVFHIFVKSHLALDEIFYLLVDAAVQVVERDNPHLVFGFRDIEHRIGGYFAHDVAFVDDGFQDVDGRDFKCVHQLQYIFFQSMTSSQSRS